MKIAEIDFPDPLLDALRDGKLVVFAGAGVSMGKPACLPDFEGLADRVAASTGQTRQDSEPVDRFLGRLQHAGVDVHARASQALSRGDLEPTELHRDLLRLYSGAGVIRIVTTNFDRLFEQVSKNVLESGPEVFQAPALPLGNDFNGIVHVHGAVSHPGGMVLTDKDFGRAYLTEGWARRFLVALFGQFTVLFVGYGHNDTVMNYLVRALPESAAGRRFALTGEHDADLQRWRILGIEPIKYPQDNDADYSKLHEGIRRLADFSRRSVLDWKREITELARKNPPLLGDEESGLIEEALKDETRTRFFTDAASSPEWIDWLDKRKHLDALFSSGDLSERDVVLVWWLAERFAFICSDKLFLLIARHDMRLHPFFWRVLGRTIGLGEQDPLDKGVLSRWISLLLATAPVFPDSGVSTVLSWIGEKAYKNGMLASLLQVFKTMSQSRLLLKPDLWRQAVGNDSTTTPVDVDLPLIGMQHDIEALSQRLINPNLPQAVEPLLGLVTKRLEERHLTLRAWQKANRKWDPGSFHRSAIEPHEQDTYPEAVDVLIDAARDYLEWLAKNQLDAAKYWCTHLVGSEAPLLRRLAVHALSARADLTADGKIDWLLERIGLHDLPAHHEIFRVVRLAYPKSRPERREAIIEAVRAFRWPDENASDKERRVAYHQMEWLHWLHGAAPDCALTKQALEDVSTQCPEFEPSEHPDLTHWTGSPQIIAPLSPWTTKELLAKPAADWLQKLFSFQPKQQPFRPEREGLVYAVGEAAKQKFDWGLDLADALAGGGEWDADLWSGLIRAWSGMDLDKDKHRTVFNRLGRVELYPKHARDIADALEALVENDGKPYALNLLPQANEIAASLWRHLDRDVRLEEVGWLNTAINHPAGVLAQFWLESLSFWRRHQDPSPKVMSDEYRTALSGIVQDPTVPGRLGRSVLAGQFAFLLAADERWTTENLIPLFGNRGNTDDFQAVWDGFLTRGRLNPTVAENLQAAFLEAVQQINGDLASRRDDFIKYYVTMLGYFAADPLETWVPKLLGHGGEKARRRFAFEIGSHLRRMDETRQREWWGRWLKRYWENRLQGVPAPLEPGEVETMLGWLTALTAVFPDAVALAVRMPQVPLQHGYGLIDGLSKSDSLVQKNPREVGKLLIYLGQSDSPGLVWGNGGRKLIDKLLQSGIPKKLVQELKELKVRRGL